MLLQNKQTFGTNPVHCKHSCKQNKSFDLYEFLLWVCVCVLVNNNVEFEAHRHISTHTTHACTHPVL